MKMVNNKMIFWKCTKCGYIYRLKEMPESCMICNSSKEKLKKIDQKQFKEIDDFETPQIKKKYRRVFKRGFTRKYTKYSKR